MVKQTAPSEKAEEAFIRKMYQMAGCQVVSFSQPRASKQTEGIPDLRIYHPRLGLAWWHEVKRQSGGQYYARSHRQTPAQQAFQSLVESCGEEYLMGARDVAEAKLRELGLIV
jgi:hypothetical protein